MGCTDFNQIFGNQFLIDLTNEERRYLALSSRTPQWDTLVFHSKTNLWYTRE